MERFLGVDQLEKFGVKLFIVSVDMLGLKCFENLNFSYIHVL